MSIILFGIIVNGITKNNDAVFQSSVFIYYDEEKENYCMGLVWDFDRSLGNHKGSPGQYTDGFYVKNVKWMHRLFEDPCFVASVKNRWNEKKNKFLLCCNIEMNEHRV
jgi:hypothetical protein